MLAKMSSKIQKCRVSYPLYVEKFSFEKGQQFSKTQVHDMCKVTEIIRKYVYSNCNKTGGHCIKCKECLFIHK